MSMWDKRYSRQEFVYGKQPNVFLVQWLDHIVEGPILCLAEGEGRNAVYLAEQGFTVTGVDRSAIGLAKAEAFARDRGVIVETIVADLASYHIEPGKYGAIISIFAHLPSTIRQQLHQKIVMGLKSGGTLLLEAFTPEQLKFESGGPPVEDMMMSLKMLLVEFAGFEIFHGQELLRNLEEGDFHQGMAAVVQVVARKPPVESCLQRGQVSRG